MANIEQVKRGIVSFAENDILAQLPGTGFKKVAIGTVLTLFINNIDNAISGQADSPILGILGVADKSGNYNVEAIADALKKNIPESGTKLDINILGYRLADVTFHRSDVDSLYNYIVNS